MTLGKQKQPGVFVADRDLVQVGRRDIEELRRAMEAEGLMRARLCAHPSVDSAVHEMLIVLKRGGYVRPHKHLSKAESLHIVEGRADAVFFDDEGSVTERLEMGDFASGLAFYYRMSAPRFHTLLLKTDYLVFKEVANGPFEPSDTAFPDWAPSLPDSEEGRRYLRDLSARLG